MEEKLKKILDIKAELKSALNSRQIEVSDKFSEFPDYIMQLGDPFSRFFVRVQGEYITDETGTYQKYRYRYSEDIFVKGERIEL